VTDLQCAARVFVARHGEADYEHELLSDHGGSLSTLGRQQSRRLGEALSGERIAHVWTSSMARAVQTAEIAAAVLGCGVTVREGLRELGVGVHAGAAPEPDPFRATFDRWLDGDLDARIEGAESGAEVVTRMSRVMGEIADLHRGEAVLVISHGGAICTAVPALAGNVHPRFPLGRPLPNAAVVQLEADDATGWRAVSWAGEDLPGRMAVD
jgi:probable phosphoglycerate mutase